METCRSISRNRFDEVTVWAGIVGLSTAKELGDSAPHSAMPNGRAAHKMRGWRKRAVGKEIPRQRYSDAIRPSIGLLSAGPG